MQKSRGFNLVPLRIVPLEELSAYEYRNMTRYATRERVSKPGLVRARPRRDAPNLGRNHTYSVSA